MDKSPYLVAIASPLPGPVLDDLAAAHPGLSVRTLLTGSVRDQSELQGLLRQLHSLGLSLLGLRQADRAVADTDQGALAANARMDVEITIAGVIGDLARHMLADWMAEVDTGTQLVVPGGGAEAAEVIVMLDRAGLVILDVRQT